MQPNDQLFFPMRMFIATLTTVVVFLMGITLFFFLHSEWVPRALLINFPFFIGAIGMGLAASSLFLQCPLCGTVKQLPLIQAFARGFSILVIFVGLFALALNSPAVTSIIGQVIRPLHADGVMSLNALCFVLTGLSLSLLDFPTTNDHYPSEYCALAVWCIMSTLLIGDIYTTTSTTQFIQFASSSALSPLLFLALSTGILWSRPRHRLMAIFFSRAPGGHLLRHLFPRALVLLIFLNFLVEWGAGQGYYEHNKVSPLITAVDAGALFILFWRTAFFLNHENEMRRQSEAALAKSNTMLNIVNTFCVEPIFVKDCEGRMIFANPAALNVIGKKNSAVIGSKSTELFSDPEDWTAINQHDRLVLTTNEAHAFEEIIHSPTGIRIFQVTKSPWVDASGVLGGIVGVATDITQRKRDEDALKAHEIQLEELVAVRTAEVRELLGYLESTREEEKRSLARELHDDLGSNLTALNMHLAIIFQKISSDLATDPAFAERSSKVQTVLAAVTATTRRIQSGLRPDKLDLLGIKVAISELAEDFHSYTGIACRTSLPDEEISYGPHLEIALFRMTQEVLSNIAKHSKANSAEVILDDVDDYVVLTIRDDGIGISSLPTNRNTHGLRTMRERATHFGGRVEISLMQERGTKITITLPKISPGHKKPHGIASDDTARR